MNTKKDNYDKINKIVLGGIAFRAVTTPMAACVSAQTNIDRRTANICRGVPRLVEVSRMILRRLAIEQAENHARGNHNFICAGYIDELRNAIRGCDGEDERYADTLPEDSERI